MTTTPCAWCGRPTNGPTFKWCSDLCKRVATERPEKYLIDANDKERRIIARLCHEMNAEDRTKPWAEVGARLALAALREGRRQGREQIIEHWQKLEKLYANAFAKLILEEIS